MMRPAQTQASCAVPLEGKRRPANMHAMLGTAHMSMALAAYRNPFAPYRTPSQTNARALMGWDRATQGQIAAIRPSTAGSDVKNLGMRPLPMPRMTIIRKPSPKPRVSTRLVTSLAVCDQALRVRLNEVTPATCHWLRHCIRHAGHLSTRQHSEKLRRLGTPCQLSGRSRAFHRACGPPACKTMQGAGLLNASTKNRDSACVAMRGVQEPPS